MPSDYLTKAIKKEINRPTTSTADAIYQSMLKKDLKFSNFETDRVKKVKEKYGL